MIAMRLLFLAIISSTFSFSQGLELGSMTSNPSISFNKNPLLKSGSNSIDSTFIFSTDTLSLPFYDEFSSNKLFSSSFGNCILNIWDVISYNKQEIINKFININIVEPNVLNVY